MTQQRFDPSLLPQGRTRTFTVVAKPNWPVGMVTTTVHLIYPGRTAATTKELVFTKRVLVVSPLVLYALAILLGCGGVFVVLRLLRRTTRTLGT